MAAKPKTAMRRFQLVREEDVSGISGVGIVAEGIQFSDGTVAMKWLTPLSIAEIAPSVVVLEEVHGHGGKTRVVYLDKKPGE
jgi:hypothetical protein